mmetsp:Transcript_11148/g.19503  ORF Transcript_11148/g.19503 Transcript_11148/m.19503 type:complete len:341 (+) Transcript_11148:685-1707(+)
MTSGFPRSQEAIYKPACHTLQVLVCAWSRQDLQCLDACCHGQRIATECACLVHGSRGGDHHHNVLAAAESAHWQATTDDLAHGGQVRGDTEVLLSAALGNTEASHDLIKAQDSALCSAHLPQTLQELLGRLNEASVANHWLENQASDLALVGCKQRPDLIQAVVGGSERGGRSAGRHTWRIRQAQGGNTRASLHQEAVSVTMIAAHKLDDLLTLGVGTHKAQHGEAGLCARRAKAHHLHAGHSLNHHLCHHILELTGSAEAGALLQLLHDDLVHFVVACTHDGRPPTADIVDVLVVIDIPGVGTLDTIEHNGAPAHRLECAHRRVHAPRQQVLGLEHDLV